MKSETPYATPAKNATAHTENGQTFGIPISIQTINAVVSPMNPTITPYE